MAYNNDTYSLCSKNKEKKNIFVIKLYYVPVIVMETLIINAHHHSIRKFNNVNKI